MSRACCRGLIMGWCLAVGLAIAIAGAGVRPARAADNARDPDLAEIIQRLQQWRSSFINVRIVYEWWGAHRMKDPKATRPSPSQRFHRDEWVWADVGAVRIEEWSYEGGQVTSHGLQAAYGPTLRRFHARYGRADKSGFPEELVLGRMASAAPIGAIGIAPVTGLYHALHCEWLDDRLAKGKCALEKYEDVDGARCARVTLEYKDTLAILWLDPSHDFLVRRIRPDPRKPETGPIFDVSEFHRVGAIWFPRRGTLDSYGSQPDDKVCWYVPEVAINLPLDAKFFEPPKLQKGTVVAEESGRVYRYGEKRPGEMREGEIADEAKKNISETDRSVSAEVPLPRSLWWSGVLLLCSTALLLFGVGAVAWRRWR